MLSKMSAVKSIIESLPLIEKIVFHIANIMGQRERFYIKVYGPNSHEIRILWGAVEIKKGQQIQMELHCTSRAIAVIHKSLMKQSAQLQSRLLVSK